jgi:hypothetical protein
VEQGGTIIFVSRESWESTNFQNTYTTYFFRERLRVNQALSSLGNILIAALAQSKRKPTWHARN